VGRGRSFAIDRQMPVPEWNPFPPVRLTATGPALHRLKKSGLASLAAESAAAAPNGDLPFNRQPLRQRRLPCPVGRVYIKRSSRKVPLSDGYLANRTRRRTAAGVQLNPVDVTSGAVHCSPRQRPALYSLRLLRTGSAPRTLVIYRLLTSPGDVVRCLSGGQPERTREVMKFKLLLDGDGRLQDPTHTDI
jgi:hypothetical protein